jgi:ABC-2 type transport system permease protein
VSALLSGELIKVRTTRTALGFAIASVLLVLAYVLVSFLAGDPTTASDKRDALNVGGVLSIPLLLFGIVGATGEYRHRTLAPAVLIAPDRLRLTAARLLAYALTALAVGVAMLAVALVIGAILLPSESGEDLAGGDYARLIAGGLITAGLITSLGVGVGLLVRNQVAGVVGVLIMVLVVSQLIAAIDETAVGYTPFGAAAKLAGDPGGGTLSWAGAALAMSGWAVALLIAAIVAEHRRDMA